MLQLNHRAIDPLYFLLRIVLKTIRRRPILVCFSCSQGSRHQEGRPVLFFFFFCIRLLLRHCATFWVWVDWIRLIDVTRDQYSHAFPTFISRLLLFSSQKVHWRTMPVLLLESLLLWQLAPESHTRTHACLPRRTKGRLYLYSDWDWSNGDSLVFCLLSQWIHEEYNDTMRCTTQTDNSRFMKKRLYDKHTQTEERESVSG